MPKQRFLVDNKKAEWVIATLLDAWRRKLPPYDRIKPVPGRLPSNLVKGSVEHAIFLFCACYYMRGKINSETALIKLSYLYEKEPWIFDPKRFAKLGRFGAWIARCRVHALLKENGLGFNSKETSRFWVSNFQKLARFWDGNPLLLFEKTSTYDELCTVLMRGKHKPDSPTGFFCFQYKMTSMLIYFYARGGLINPFTHPGPIDFHNNRLAACTGIVRPVGMRAGTRIGFEPMSEVMRRVYLKFCPDTDTTLALADAIWYLSRSFCSASQGNSSHHGVYRGRRTTVTAKRVTWTKAREATYNKTCGLCPIESACKWSIPSADNYNAGVIQVRGLRPKPHEAQHKLLEVPRVLSTRPALPVPPPWQKATDEAQLLLEDIR